MLHEIIKNRKSTVLFDSERELKIDLLEELFETARWAPSSMNLQPWRFIYAQKTDDGYKNILACLASNNQEWAKNAPVLIVTVAQVISDYKDRNNTYAWHDTAMAYASLVLHATSMGLSLHPMGGYDREKLIKATAIPERYEPVIVAALGYKADHNKFPSHLINRENSPRNRKPLTDILFRDRFGNR